MINIVPYAREHILYLRDKTIEPKLKISLQEIADRIVEPPKSYAHTMLFNNEVVSIIGLDMLHPGVGDIWVVNSPRIKDCLKDFCKLCRELMQIYEDVVGVHRFQAVVRGDFKEGIKWARIMGFNKEATLRQFGDDKSDWILCARIKK